MASEMQNLNPTILNAADLPTRQLTSPGKSSDDIGGLFASALSPPNLRDPFAISVYDSPDSESDAGDLMEEPIDEQEIFGNIKLPFVSRTPPAGSKEKLIIDLITWNLPRSCLYHI
jgi:hypothetical protein